MNNPQSPFLKFSQKYTLIAKNTLAINVIKAGISTEIIVQLTKKTREEICSWIASEVSKEIRKMTSDQLVQIADQFVADCLKIDKEYPVNLSNNIPPDDAG
jgi:hypothetical protein